MMTIQIANVLSFVLCLFLNGTAEIGNFMNVGIQAAPFTFAIWAVIYLLLLVFVIYQALPADMVPNRPDDLIFNQIGYYFMINMVLNGVWIQVFTLGTNVGYLLSIVIIAVMLLSTLDMAMTTLDAMSNGELDDTLVARISLRGGMSIYAGWLTAANIIAGAQMLKLSGMSEANGYDEELWTLVMLAVATVVFGATTYINDDPVYGAVLIWATIGIRGDNWLESNAVEMTTNAIIGLATAFVIYVAIE